MSVDGPVEHVESPTTCPRSCAAVMQSAFWKRRQLQWAPTRSTAPPRSWVPLHDHADIGSAISHLKQRGFRLFGTNLSADARDYRACDFTGPCAFVLGAEKWGLTEEATAMMDQAVLIPMRGMVQSLNVSVATATLLFEALRQRQVAGLAPQNGEGIPAGDYDTLLFEWCYPEVAAWCREQGRHYPALGEEGEILEELPRTAKLRC